MLDRDLYSLPEARERLGGISHSSVYKLIGRGDLRVTKVLGRTFVSAAEIKRFLEAAGVEVSS